MVPTSCMFFHSSLGQYYYLSLLCFFFMPKGKVMWILLLLFALFEHYASATKPSLRQGGQYLRLQRQEATLSAARFLQGEQNDAGDNDCLVEDLQSTCQACFGTATLGTDVTSTKYNCSLPGLTHFGAGGQYEGVTANYLSFVTQTSSPMLPHRAAEFEACTGGHIIFSEARNIWEDPVQDLGTKTSRGSEVYDGYFMSYSHFPEVSALGLAEPLNERIRQSNERLKWEDVFPKVQAMGEYRDHTDGSTRVDFLMYDGDFFVPVIRLDLLEQHDLPLPNTWEEVVEIAKFFHDKDLNEDGTPDFGFCHFPRIGAGNWDWWFSESVYSTWATLAQTHGLRQGFFFNERTMQPKLGAAFRRAVTIWKDLWSHGHSSKEFIEGRCAVGFGPPGEWKRLFLEPNGVSRINPDNGTVVWRPTFRNGEYAEPYRLRPFGSLEVEDPETGEMAPCTPDLCPKAERIPMKGHHDGNGYMDAKVNVLPVSPLEGKLVNRAPFYWSGGLGTLIRKSSPKQKKDLLWDFFVYTNSPDTAVHDVASYASWLDSWRYSQLEPGNNFLQAGWSVESYMEHLSVMKWALSREVNGALNIRIPGAIRYTRDVVGEQMRFHIDGNFTLDQMVEAVKEGWNQVTQDLGLLDQLEVYRSSLGLDRLSQVDLCRLHRSLMDERDPSVCRQYDPVSSDHTILVASISAIAVLMVLASLAFVYYEHKRKAAQGSVWQIKREELKYEIPPEVIGRGTFGEVLLAEYRGTRVAVKRVIPPVAFASATDSYVLANGHDVDSRVDPPESTTANDGDHPEEREDAFDPLSSSSSDGYKSGAVPTSMRSTRAYKRNQEQKNINIVTKDDYDKLKADFIVEMKQLADLRHPCITTIMGAVTEKTEEPLLVMEYMDHGSLYDILHNNTMVFDGEILLPILRDIATGVRFLHSATPQIIHADLKASNILVDERFRAKVSDFGLTQKRNVGAFGSPFWMAPEVLRKETGNTAESDVYAYGMILWEIYSRKDPYAGEDWTEVVRLVADLKVNKRPPIPDKCPPHARSLMMECMYSNPEKRPTFEEIDLRLKRMDSRMMAPLPIDSDRVVVGIPEKQQGPNKDILYDVFPPYVAQALREGRPVEPRSHDLVTVAFIDICSFTRISSLLPPLKVSEFLGRLYNRFDGLARLHGVYKIETIGDCYMAVTNLIEEQRDHVKRIAEFCIAAVAAANETMIDFDQPGRGTVNVRAGFHCGPCCANVVGHMNPRFCLFGDVVNTSSRMESSSKMNRIQCSERAARLLQDQWPTAQMCRRGIVSIKGKGEMLTYWVNEAEKPVEKEDGRWDVSGGNGRTRKCRFEA